MSKKNIYNNIEVRNRINSENKPTTYFIDKKNLIIGVKHQNFNYIKRDYKVFSSDNSKKEFNKDYNDLKKFTQLDFKTKSMPKE